MKPWTNKAWLHNKYIVKGMSCEQIAQELRDGGTSVTSMTIYNWTVRHNLVNPKCYGKRTIPGNRPRYY